MTGSTAIAAIVSTSACAQSPRVYGMKVSRDLGCMCCHAWTEVLQRSERFRITLVDDPDLPRLKQRLGVPSHLGSCHTGLVEGYVVEGHVPVEDILRLLEARPPDVRGIAVPGMPRGSPGMEQPNGKVDAFNVTAFGRDGAERVFSQHAASI
jgi:hypothetical protein